MTRKAVAVTGWDWSSVASVGGVEEREAYAVLCWAVCGVPMVGSCCEKSCFSGRWIGWVVRAGIAKHLEISCWMHGGM